MRFSLLISLVAMNVFFACPSSLAQTDTPGLSEVAELQSGYQLLYEQQFSDARQVFEKWAAANPAQPFGQVSLAASYLFEEFFIQRVLTSEYFLNDKRFVGGIEGTPDAGRIKNFNDSVARARELAAKGMKKTPKDPESLF